MSWKSSSACATYCVVAVMSIIGGSGGAAAPSVNLGRELLSSSRTTMRPWGAAPFSSVRIVRGVGTKAAVELLPPWDLVLSLRGGGRGMGRGMRGGRGGQRGSGSRGGKGRGAVEDIGKREFDASLKGKAVTENWRGGRAVGGGVARWRGRGRGRGKGAGGSRGVRRAPMSEGDVEEEAMAGDNQQKMWRTKGRRGGVKEKVKKGGWAAEQSDSMEGWVAENGGIGPDIAGKAGAQNNLPPSNRI